MRSCLDGKFAGVVEYQLEDAVMTIPHVEVVPELRGKGYSAPFLDEVLQLVRDRGLKIVPLCGYARSHIRERPDLQDLFGSPRILDPRLRSARSPVMVL